MSIELLTIPALIAVVLLVLRGLARGGGDGERRGRCFPFFGE